MGLPRIALTGGLVQEPQLRFSQAGNAVVTLRVVCKDRKRGANGGWEDADPTFLSVVAFGKPAENLVESVKVGDQVSVQGRLRMREWDDEKTGSKRQVLEVLADELAVAVTFHPVNVDRDKIAASARPKQEDPWAVGDEPAPF